MKTTIFYLSVILALMLAVSCGDDEEIVYSSKLENVMFVSSSLDGNAAGNSTFRDMVVYTPKAYYENDGTNYPVAYLLHGLPHTDSAYISKTHWDQWINPAGPFTTYPDFPQEGFKQWVDNLIESNTIEPMIIVMPDSKSDPYGFCFYTNSVLNGNWEDYIADDVVEFVDANYNTIADKNGRAVIGHSQGGYGAMRMGLMHSDVFGYVAAHSAPLYFQAFPGFTDAIIAENPDGNFVPDKTKFLTSSFYAFASAWSPNMNKPPFFVDLPFEFPSGEIVPDVWARWLEHDPFTLLGTHGSNLKTLNGLFFDAGLNDVFMFNLTSDAFHQALDASGISHTYENYDGDHFDKMFERLEVSLGFISQGMVQ